MKKLSKHFLQYILSASVITATTVAAQDIDVEKHVKKYWTKYHNQQIVVGNGDKRWPVTPELKAERLRHFTAMMERFAPHHVEEAKLIDRIFNWQEGTYLATLRFGIDKTIPASEEKNLSHECTSWIVMDNLTGGKSIIMHKNRDSKGGPLVLLRRAMPGKHAWIGNGSQFSFYPSQGINDRGLVVMMNSGDPLPEAENSQYGLPTMVLCRMMLEDCGTAEEAVELLKKAVYANAYTHVESGSIWFIGDSNNVYIAEHSARKITVKAVNSGFSARANAFQYPEMQIYSLRNQGSLAAHARREFAVRDLLINTQWRKNGIVTPLDSAAASRINSIPKDPKCYPPCGKNTISTTTFVIDKEYPEYLSSAYMTFSSPQYSCYLPVPLTVRNIPEAILNGSYSEYCSKRWKENKPLLPAEELAALEKRLYQRHAEAVEKARVILRTETSTSPSAQEKAAAVLNSAFEENFNEMKNVLKFQ